MESLNEEVNDLETGESWLDCETGEIKIATKYHRKNLTKYKGNYMKVTISTNDETGEPEWVYEDRSNVKDSCNACRKFHIPTPIHNYNSQSRNPENSSSSYNTQGTHNYEEKKKMWCLFYCNPIFVFFPLVCFYPALAALLGVLFEATIHAWFHRRDGKLPPEKRHFYRLYRSPIHKFLSEFCAVCQADRMVYMVGKIHDAKLRMKGRAVGSSVRGCGMPGTQVLTTG